MNNRELLQFSLICNLNFSIYQIEREIIMDASDRCFTKWHHIPKVSIKECSTELPGDHLPRQGFVDRRSTSASALLGIAYFPNGQTCVGFKHHTRTVAVIAQFTRRAPCASALDPREHSGRHEKGERCRYSSEMRIVQDASRFLHLHTIRHQD